MASPQIPPSVDDFHQYPDARGHFGPYGGSFVAETLMQPLAELAEAYRVAQSDPAFQAELADDYRVMERGEGIASGPGCEMTVKNLQQLVAI